MNHPLLCALLALLPSTVAAQIDPPFDLLELPGDQAHVRYTPGSLERSSHLQDRLDLFLRDLGRRTKLPISITAMVLSREEWVARRITRPYGAPALVDGMIALPAFGDQGTVQLWRQLAGSLPAAAASPLRGEPEEVASLGLADLISLPQLATAILERNLRGEEPWIVALAGQVAHRLYLEKYEPRRFGELGQLYFRAAEQAPAASLGEYRREQPLPEQLAWDARLWQAAGLVIEEDGGNSLKRLFKLQQKGDGLLTRRALLDRYRDLGPWMASLAAGRGAG